MVSISTTWKSSNHIFLRGLFLSSKLLSNSLHIVYFTNLRFGAKSAFRLVLPFSHNHHNSRNEIEIWVYFKIQRRSADSLLLKYGDIKYKLSIFYAVFSWAFAIRRNLIISYEQTTRDGKWTKAQSTSCSGLRLNNWLVTSVLHCIVAPLHALFYRRICVTLLRYTVTCTRAWFSSIWFELRSDTEIVCGMRG